MKYVGYILVLVVFMFMFQSELKAQLEYENIELMEIPWDDMNAEALESAATYWEDYDNLKTNPLNINNLNEKNIESLFFLNPLQQKELLKYVKVYGPLNSKSDLYLLPHFDIELVNLLIACVVVEPVIWSSNQGLKQDLLIRTAYKRDNNGQANNKLDSLSPFTHLSKNISYKGIKGESLAWGLKLENDAGEDFGFSNNKRGFDFISGYIEYKGTKFIKKIVVGDYQLKIGQGALAWSGFSFKKTTDIGSLNKSSQNLVKYFSFDENNFFRGTSCELETHQVTIQPFFSVHKVDASINNTDSTISISNLQETGLHITPNEQANEKQLEQKFGGINLYWKNFVHHLGVMLAHWEQNLPLIKQDHFYNELSFKGDKATYLSMNYNSWLGKINLYGENVLMDNGSTATINGLLVDVDDGIQSNLIYRNVSPQYYTPYGNIISENSSVVNEEGLLWGLSIKSLKSVKFGAYIDLYSFPWLKYRVNAPSSGKEMQGFVDYKQDSLLFVHFQLKYEQRDINQLVAENPILQSEPASKLNPRLEFHIYPNSILELSTRLDWSFYKTKMNEIEKGFLFYEDISIHNHANTWQIRNRICYFETTWNTRIYAYEPDILYVFSYPMYYGHGLRWVSKYKTSIRKNQNLWFKIGYTKFITQELILSQEKVREWIFDAKIEWEWKF